METNLKHTSMKQLSQTNQTTTLHKELETRKKVLTEIGTYSQSKEEEGIIKAQLADAQIKFYDFNNAQHKKVIVSLLMEWSIMLGIKEPMTPEYNVVNAKFLIDNYYFLTISEIRQAMQWSITGKLDIDPTCYGLLAPIYIAKILNKYIGKKDAVMQMLHFRRNEKVGIAKLKEKHKIPYSESVNNHKAFLIEHMSLMKSKKVPDVAGNLVWRFLQRCKVVSEKSFNQESSDYANEKMATLKVTRDYRDEISKLTKNQIEVKTDVTIERFMQDYVIFQFISTIDDIASFVNNKPNEVIVPKQENHDN